MSKYLEEASSKVATIKSLHFQQFFQRSKIAISKYWKNVYLSKENRSCNFSLLLQFSTFSIFPRLNLELLVVNFCSSIIRFQRSQSIEISWKKRLRLHLLNPYIPSDFSKGTKAYPLPKRTVARFLESWREMEIDSKEILPDWNNAHRVTSHSISG